MAHPHWENPEVVGIGRLPARSHFKRYATGADALSGKNERQLSLNGTWHFRRVGSPNLVPDDWLSTTAGPESWRAVTVPSLWTRQGGVDRPIYTNVVMPFRAEPPLVPDENPTGLYRRTFDLPAAWWGKRVVIHLGGVENCFYLYCNGREVGFSKDCRLPAEFDLTEYLAEGANELALKVLHFSDSSYIEDQDQWWHAGIHRDIHLYPTAPVYLRDINAMPRFDETTGSGTLQVEVRVGEENRSATGSQIEIEVISPTGKPVFKAPLIRTLEKGRYTPVLGPGPMLRFDAKVGKVRPWSAETPELYDLLVTLKDPRGTPLESTRVRIGFRHIAIKNRQLLINGAPVLIKGVNRHDHCDITGKVITEDLMRADIETMKQHNINAVRTSHYPNDSRFYELCDEYGLYVVDECNIEAHHHYQQLGRDPAWASAFINRVVRMVERDKNHPSIIIWSMGNETGFGPHHAAMAAWVRSYDPSRPIHNENAICEQAVRNRWEDNPHGTDIICPMYPSVEDIENHARTSTDPRPLIMCEYAHAMGNSCGNLKEYWDAIENHHGLQGGFIWEWLDQGLLETANGIPYWAYGGDFGEERHDLNFVCDGLCWPDRAPHSSLIEYKHIIAPVAVTKVRGKTFRFFNKNWFTDFRQYVITWELLRNGEIVQQGHTRKLRTPPQAATDLKVDYELPPLKAGDEVSIVFTFRLARSLSWAPRGHVVAEKQIEITTRAPKSRPARKTGKAVVATKSADAILVHCGDMEVEFGNDGIHWRNNGREIINQGPMLNVWRAPIDNDGIKGRESQDGKPLGRWQALGIDHIKRTSSMISLQEINKETANVNLRQIFNPATGQIDMETTFIVSADAIDVVHHFELSKALVDLPRLGVRLKLPSDFEDFSWFGRGPHETYIDRRASGTVRIHHSTVENQYVPYILPQEHGNLTDVRWLELRAAENQTLRISRAGKESIEASASHYPHEILTPAFHTYEITPDPATWVTLDVMQRGVGGGSCGPDTRPQYRLTAGKHHLSYRLALTT